MSTNSKNILKHLSIITLLFVVSLVGILFFVLNISSESQIQFDKDNQSVIFSPFVRTSANTIVSRKEFEYDKAVKKSGVNNPIISVVRTSTDFNQDIPFTVDNKAGVLYKKKYDGRRVNICITGVDSRLGNRYVHADANHVLSILVDKGEIEITSIPRDTYADAGMPDTTNQNIIAVLRPAKGRKAYLNRIAQIAELDTIHYYMEFGFSQAIGIIEWLGYDNSKQTLQVLRSRKVFGGGDWQRTYNQGKFMKQAVVKSFNNYGGIFGDLVLMGGLSLVETNINTATLNTIIKKLKSNNFGQSDDITLRIRPEFNYQYKNFDFNDKNVVAQLHNKVNDYSISKNNSDNNINSIDTLVIKKLNKAIIKAIKLDSSSRSNETISTLKTYFQQKAWLQITNKKTRHNYRERIKQLLMSAYIQKNEPDNAEKIKRIVEQESNLFLYNLNRNKIDFETLPDLIR